MKTLKLEIFTLIYDDDFYNIIDKQHKYTATYTDNFDLLKIENDLYSLLGEGIKVSTNHNETYSIISINLLGDRSIDKLLEYLKEYKITENSPDIYESFTNIDFEEYIQFSTADTYLNEHELKLIHDILEESGAKYKILSGNEIYEKGASSYWAAYLIGVAGGLTVQFTMRIFDVIKEKIFDKDAIDTLKVQSDIKNKLLNEYDLKPSQIYLSRYYKREDKIVELTYKTEDSVIRVQTDEKGGIIKFNKSSKRIKEKKQ